MKYLDGGQLTFLLRIDKKSHFSICRKCLCWSSYNDRLVSGTRVYCQKSARRTGSEDENGTVESNVSIFS